MATVARAGVSHILDMQIEFDDTALAAPHNIIVQWTPTDDDFQPKPPEIFQRGVNFARQALDEEGTKLLVHCAAGVHRATHDDTGDTLFSELEHEGCNEVDWRQASCSGLWRTCTCAAWRSSWSSMHGQRSSCAGRVVTKTAPEFGCLS